MRKATNKTYWSPFFVGWCGPAATLRPNSTYCWKRSWFPLQIGYRYAYTRTKKYWSKGNPGWVDLVQLKQVDLVRRVCGAIPWKVSAADQVRHRKVDLVRYGGITGERRSWKRRWGWVRLSPGAKGCAGAPGRPQNSIARGKSGLYSPWREAYQRSHTRLRRGSREPQLQQADDCPSIKERERHAFAGMAFSIV